MSERIVIVGAGHAAGQVVSTLRHRDFGGEIVVLGDEPWLPYQRPPLSKKYLSGDLPRDRLLIRPPEFYDEPGTDVRLGMRVDEIDRGRGEVRAGGDRIGYDRLVIATGASVRRLAIDGADLDGVHYLRSIDDVDRIRGALEGVTRVAIVGAGYIGLEVAAVLAGRDLDVTVVEMAERVMSRVVSPQVSAFFEREHKSRGVRLMLSTGIAAFEGDARVSGIRTNRGDVVPADLVVVGIGIQPNTELADAAGLAVDNGIVVDDTCRTADPAIYAVGDCTLHPSRVYDRTLRLESVHNAVEQAKTAALCIVGDETHYDQVPWFWSDQYDIKLQIAGLSEDYDDVVIRGDMETRSFSCLYLDDGRLIAVDAINAPRDFMQSKPLIAAGARPDPGLIADTGTSLADLG